MYRKQPISGEPHNKPGTGARRFDPLWGLVYHQNVYMYHDRRTFRVRREGRSPVPTKFDFS